MDTLKPGGNDRSLGRRLVQQRQDAGKSKRLLAVYDLLGHGYSYDVCIFLVAAEMVRREKGCDKIDLVFVAHASAPASPSAPYVTEENFRHYIHNIMLEASRLLGTVGSVFVFDDRKQFDEFLNMNSDNYFFFPFDHEELIRDEQTDTLAPLVSFWTRQIEAGVVDHPDLFCLYPPHEQIALCRKWLLVNAYPRIPITITLREVEWRSVVNNQVDQWQKLIDSYAGENYVFIILRDYYKIYDEPVLTGENVLYYNEPLVSLSLRAALYQECSLNLFVPNGCAVLAMFNNRCNYIYFATQCVGLSMNGCYETNPFQKIIYGTDDFVSLKKTCDRLLAKMDKEHVCIPPFYGDKSVEERDSAVKEAFSCSNSSRQKYLHLYTPEYLKKKIEELVTLWQKQEKRIVVYGAGYHTTNLFDIGGLGAATIVAIADRDLNTHGERRFGFTVISPSEIATVSPDVVLISSNAYQDEIYESLQHLQKTGIELVRLYSIEDEA